jgi:sorting nexin-25
MNEPAQAEPASYRRTLIGSSVLVLLGSLLAARFTYYQTLVIGPAFLALLACIAAYLVITALIESDADPPPRHRPYLRPLTFTTPSAWSAILTRQAWEEHPTTSRDPALLSSAPGAVKSALDRLLALIRIHFILPWYSRISPSPAFPNSTDTLVRLVIANVVKQGYKVDWSSLLVSRIVPIVKDHLHHYRTVEHLASSSSTPRTALALPLPAKPHPALSVQSHTSSSGTPPLVEAHLREQIDKLLKQMLPEADRSEVVSLLIREILLGAVLLPVYDLLCDPDFWNRQIDDRGGRYLHEQ